MSYPTTEAEAVLFFSGKLLVRELLYSEFEAVLDGFIPLPEQAGETVAAVYLRIASGYHAGAAVFFKIDFDDQGYPDKRWGVPLEQLADTALKGPDMGAGPIRLACRSQCSIAWHQEQLWDPQMTPECNHFGLIKKALKRNRLRLNLSTPEPESDTDATSDVEASAADKELLRKRMAQAIKEQRLRVATLQEQHRQALEQLESEWTAKNQQQLQQIATLSDSLAESQERCRELEALTEGQAQKISGLRDYFEHKLSSLKSLDDASLETMRSRIEDEKQAELREATESLTEQLQMRDIEVMYRDTRIAGLEDEIERLQKEKEELLSSSGDSLLEQLHKSGISFVTFQPGAGHMTLPIGDIARFMADADAYTAQRCKVDEAAFRLWRDHYHNPRCIHKNTDGTACRRPIDRVERPGEFFPGDSDRCSEHNVTRSQSDQAASI
ncbi:hypothetical protein KOI40_11930 [Aestuariicella sp. G3-2]|uniref:hypothetical protein n=1 Tax=Pseudomaricurvus albidus TaxID=2842452 RepID=UPI001C0CDFE7|nr:hypothetical protein [Aestuariicella albida]MBU3070533.1 hypothetical protein [Aestuariicella albida]